MEDEEYSTGAISAENQEMGHLIQPKEENDDEARSESTPSCDEEESKEDMKERMKDLKNTVTYLSHQITQIMNAMHVQACTCATCAARAQNGHSNGLANQSNESLSLGTLYGQHVGGGKMPPYDRRTVSDYALQHGGIAAVRRFGVPASVSSYYQRKDSISKGNTSPGPSTDGDRNGDDQAALAQMDSMLKMSSSFTGTPGFLRGRGRGRPKLIGDELDADLVEYMVQLQKADPHLMRMSATQALDIARAYILEKAPGLLEEQGGHVKLKLTWAMKLVQRIAERQKEIELGLPAGTLQNMGKSQQIAEIMAMSKFGGFPGATTQINGSGPGGLEQALQQAAAAVGGSAPEIMNVRELDLSNLTGGGGQPGDLPLIGANGEILFPHDGNDEE